MSNDATAPDTEDKAKPWREAVEHISRQARRANYEYVSKNELRMIAKNALATLHVMYTAGLQRAEAEVAPKESVIVTPDTSIVVP